MNEKDQKVVDTTPFDETEINYQDWLDDTERSLAGKTVDELKRTIVGLSRRLAFRFKENQELSVGFDRVVEGYNALKDANQMMDTRSLRRIQADVGRWRQEAYPDTATVELQALGVAEESGELAHAVLKFKQGIRGYDLEKTRTEVADAIGDIIIYAMGVADCLGINVEEALYSTAHHVINRNITQGSDTGDEVLMTHTNIASMTVTKYRKGDRVRVVGGEHFLNQLGTVHPAPGVDPYWSATELFVMIDGKDSPWCFPVTHLMKVGPIEQAVKSVDYAGHVPAGHHVSCNDKSCTGGCY